MNGLKMSEDLLQNNIHAIPQFIRKLFNILNDPRHSEHIHWSQNGDSFIIVDPIEFCNTVLASHFKHSNISSFIRQLNKYDFHKIRANTTAKKRLQNKMWEFSHPNFKRNRPDLLPLISRKTTLGEKTNQEGGQEGDQESSMVLHSYIISSMANITKYFEMITEDLKSIKKMFHRQCYGAVEQSIKTLIAEDNATCASYASLILKRLNFLTVSVESIVDFTFFFKNEKFDLILLSSHIPNVKELLSNIRSKNAIIPIILTSDENEDTQTLFYKYPMVNKILHKPFSHEELIGYVKSLNLNLYKAKEEDRINGSRYFYT